MPTARPDRASTIRALRDGGLTVLAAYGYGEVDLDDAVPWALSHAGPTLLDIITNPNEVSVPPKPTVAQGWGFAIAKSREALESR